MPDCPKPEIPIDVTISKETFRAQYGHPASGLGTNVGAPITFTAGGLTVTDTIPRGSP